MTPTSTDSGPARAVAVRQARAIRTRTIRRRVIAGALSMFVATWLFITLMLVSGHDPALARQASSSVTAAQTATASTGSGTDGGSSGSASTGTTGSDTSGGATAASTSSGTTSSVTTQQS